MIKLIGSEDYYPTPESLLDQITAGIDWKFVKTVLEPSAGKGNIAEYVAKKQKMKLDRNDFYREKHIDVIEIEPELQAILKDKGFCLVHNDFLTFHTYKHYDLIIMNPPFSAGAKHLLKAIEVQQTSGGAIICILNAETLRNPYTNERKDLAKKLETYNAEIEYYENAFSSSERPTDVEIAVVKLILPEPASESTIFKTLREKEYTEYQDKESYEIVESDFIKMSIALYNREIEIGLRLYQEYREMQKYCLDESLILLGFNEGEYNRQFTEFNINGYVYEVRRKYWSKFFKDPKITGKLTTDLYNQYISRVNEFVCYDFSFWNIKTIQAEIASKLVQGVEDAIIKLFEDLSHKHYWDEDGTSGNIHYYNGWKTNSAYKINKKVILPMQAFYTYSRKLEGNFSPCGRCYSTLSDIERVLNYLDTGETPEVDLDIQLQEAGRLNQTRNIECKYFTLTFYKKGTCHITFTNERLLKKFNIFGSQKKGWLPKGYARKRYEEMNSEEQSVIESFEGRESYNESLMDAQYYLFNVSSSLPMLSGGANNEIE